MQCWQGNVLIGWNASKKLNAILSDTSLPDVYVFFCFKTLIFVSGFFLTKIKWKWTLAMNVELNMLLLLCIISALALWDFANQLGHSGESVRPVHKVLVLLFLNPWHLLCTPLSLSLSLFLTLSLSPLCQSPCPPFSLKPPPPTLSPFCLSSYQRNQRNKYKRVKMYTICSVTMQVASGDDQAVDVSFDRYFGSVSSLLLPQ